MAGWRDWSFRAVIGALLFAASAETAVRLTHPRPRVQLITAAGTSYMEQPLTDRGGVPVWRDTGSAARRRCPEGATRTALILGTSISFGVELPPAQVFSHHLQAALDARAPGVWCVDNAAQPGFTIDSMLAVLRDEVSRKRPDVVLLELGNLGSYTMMDGVAYNLHDVAVGPSGFPELVPLPAPLHRWLMGRSAAWRYVHLSFVTETRDGLAEDARRRALMDEAARLTAGARLLLWVPVRLDGAAEDLFDPAPIPDWAAEHGVPLLQLREAWSGRELGGWALDRVHLNAAGQEALGGTLLTWLDANGALPAR